MSEARANEETREPEKYRREADSAKESSAYVGSVVIESHERERERRE